MTVCEEEVTYPCCWNDLEGGLVFYVDETGERGLVAALEDLGTYEWVVLGKEV